MKQYKKKISAGTGAYLRQISKNESLSKDEQIHHHGVILNGRKKIAETIQGKESLKRLKDIISQENNDERLDDKETILILKAIENPSEKNMERLKRVFLTIDFDVLKQYCANDKELNKILFDIKESRDALILSCIKWVVSIAKTYVRVSTSMTFDDLIQEGNIGLIKAVDKFDPNRGGITTVASWWIRQSIIRSLSNKERQIRIPVHILEVFNKVLREASQSGQTPTADEVYKKIKIPNMNVYKVREIMAIMNGPVSIHETLKDENGDETSTYETFLEDMTETVESHISKDQIKHILIQEMMELSPREEKCIRLYLGF